MKKRNFISLLIILLTLIGLLIYLYSKAINVGASLETTHPYLAYAFYAIVSIVVLYFIVRPFLIILFSPSLSFYHLKEIDSKKEKKRNYKKLVKLSKRISKKKLVKRENIVILNNELTKSYDNFDEKYLNLKKTIRNVLNDDLKKDIRKIIISSARDTMYLTALSQNSFIDILVVVVNNFNMVKKIVTRCGFRPSYVRLMKLYLNVVMSSLIAEGAENIDFGSLLGGSLKGLAKPLVGSVIDGALNSFFMLRTGFLTRNYIFEESEENKYNIIKSAMVEAAAALPELAVQSVMKPVVDALKGTIVTPTKEIVKKVFSSKPVLEEITE